MWLFDFGLTKPSMNLKDLETQLMLLLFRFVVVVVVVIVVVVFCCCLLLFVVILVLILVLVVFICLFLPPKTNTTTTQQQQKQQKQQEELKAMGPLLQQIVTNTQSVDPQLIEMVKKVAQRSKESAIMMKEIQQSRAKGMYIYLYMNI